MSFLEDTLVPFITGVAGASMGNRMGDQSYKYRSELDWQMAQARGLTPQEFYGSPVPGGTSSSAGNNLGNNLTQSMIANKQLAFQAEQNEKERSNKLDIAKVQAGANKYSADISAGASRYATEIKQLIADKRLRFDEQLYRNVSLPGAQANIGLTKKQTLKVVNDIATSDPKFVKAMKLLSMGTENMVATMVANSSGIDVTNPKELLKLTEKQRQTLLATMIAAGGHSRKEIEGLIEMVKGLLNTEDNPSRPVDHPALGNGKEITVWDTPFFSIKKH